MILSGHGAIRLALLLSEAESSMVAFTIMRNGTGNPEHA
jgi:hypothetical protein